MWFDGNWMFFGGFFMMLFWIAILILIAGWAVGLPFLFLGVAVTAYACWQIFKVFVILLALLMPID